MDSSHARNIAGDILARRDHSIREMKMKLRKKGVSEEDAESTIAWLVSKRLLDDRAFAERRAESIFRTKLVGPKWIAYKLKQAGVSSDTIEEVVSALGDREVWDERAQEALMQWKKVHPKHKDDTVRHMRFLASRGFDNIVY